METQDKGPELSQRLSRRLPISSFKVKYVLFENPLQIRPVSNLGYLSKKLLDVQPCPDSVAYVKINIFEVSIALTHFLKHY